MKIIGHRGARGLAPENTLASIRKALEHGVDMVEFDVRVTKDKVAVLHHDPKIKINGSSLKIANSGFSQLVDLKPDLTRLTDAFEVIGAKAQICIEIKAGVNPQPVIAAIEPDQQNILIGSKSFNILLEVHKTLPDIPIIVIEPWSGVRATRRARQLNTKYIAMNQLWLWRGFIQPIANKGWKLMAYTLNDPVTAKRWKGYGLYGVTTDYPDRFL